MLAEVYLVAMLLLTSTSEASQAGVKGIWNMQIRVRRANNSQICMMLSGSMVMKAAKSEWSAWHPAPHLQIQLSPISNSLPIYYFALFLSVYQLLSGNN